MAAADRPFVDTPAGPPAAVDEAARLAAERFGVGPVRLLRLGMNGVYEGTDVVLRVARTTVPATLGLQLAGALADAGIPVARPASGVVVDHDGLSVTAWERLEASGAPIDWHAVGRAVARLHDLGATLLPSGYPVPSPSTFPWWDFDAILADVSPFLDDASRTGLADAIERHRGWRQWVHDDAVLCHGDVHPGNVVMTASGPVLVDWDLVCTAPRGWDHAPMTTWAARWGGAGHEYRAFADGYGASLAADRVTQAFAELRLVAATLMRVRAGLEDPSARTEAERRLRFWRGDPEAPAWTAQ